MGSISSEIVQHAVCPIVIVPYPHEAHRGGR
jgi:hypothetical protein